MRRVAPARSRGPVSLVGYRINSSATTLGNKMERLGAGLVWNGVSPINLPNNPVHVLDSLGSLEHCEICHQ